MTRAGWHIRLGRPDDRELLASFACADPAVRWQAEVEQFIQERLADWALDPRAYGTTLPATKLEVVGVALKWQGRSFTTGERASDVLMSAVMTDVSSRVPPRDARVYAIVHEDNHRSLALCRRHGLTEEMSRPHPSYRRTVTPHKQR